MEIFRASPQQRRISSLGGGGGRGGWGGDTNTGISPPPDNTLNMPPKFDDTLQIQNINEPGLLN